MRLIGTSILMLVMLTGPAQEEESLVPKSKSDSWLPGGYSCFSVQRIVRFVGIDLAIAAAREDGWTSMQIEHAKRCM